MKVTKYGCIQSLQLNICSFTVHQNKLKKEKTESLLIYVFQQYVYCTHTSGMHIHMHADILAESSPECYPHPLESGELR